VERKEGGILSPEAAGTVLSGLLHLGTGGNSSAPFSHPLFYSLMRKSVLLARRLSLPALLATAPLAVAALPSATPAAAPETPARAYADITITGQVNDEKGEGLPGVTVIVKGTSNGASTDATGKFTLTVSSARRPDGRGIGGKNRRGEGHDLQQRGQQPAGPRAGRADYHRRLAERQQHGGAHPGLWHAGQQRPAVRHRRHPDQDGHQPNQPE
nr:hypothetical protein [Tanacetum cinerariifolium]